jgi:hypothetical protein
MENGIMEISKKTLKVFITAVIVSFPVVAISWIVLCNNIESKAQNYINKSIDNSSRIYKLEQCYSEQKQCIKGIKDQVDFIVLVEQQKMTWEDKKNIVDLLVKNRSLSYEAAFKLVNQSYKGER